MGKVITTTRQHKGLQLLSGEGKSSGGLEWPMASALPVSFPSASSRRGRGGSVEAGHSWWLCSRSSFTTARADRDVASVLLLLPSTFSGQGRWQQQPVRL